MKKFSIIILLLFVLHGITVAQIGINTNDPEALLDIRALNKTAPEQNIGVIFPRITSFPATDPTADQHGAMIFLNHDNAIDFWKNSFYFWNNDIPAWDQLQDINTADIDYNKIICTGNALYDSSGNISTLKADGPRYVRLSYMDSPLPSFQLTANGELKIGKKGRYALAFTGGIQKQHQRITDYKCEVLINGTTASPPIASLINLAGNFFRAGVFATTQFVELNANDLLSIQVSLEYIAPNGDYNNPPEAKIDSPFALMLTLIQEL
ncbi:hypothetical protein [Dysgonomonas sp. 520]|uniref:hypothetical protein n=1 Tax=Dysgonomonas sp. 520 TaxID=2302931 RepID=UPI0013D7F83B|nr:hypothetical protein [Dysgonomonas sp. 520]NDW08482.1 hypothetical protein [Dysgonomonas sp. 520]